MTPDLSKVSRICCFISNSEQMGLGSFSVFLILCCDLVSLHLLGKLPGLLWMVKPSSVYMNLASLGHHLVFCIAIALASCTFGAWARGGSPGSGAGAAAREEVSNEGANSWYLVGFCNLTLSPWFTICIITINWQSFKHRQLFNTKAKLAFVCGSRISPNKVCLRNMVKCDQPRVV